MVFPCLLPKIQIAYSQFIAVDNQALRGKRDCKIITNTYDQPTWDRIPKPDHGHYAPIGLGGLENGTSGP